MRKIIIACMTTLLLVASTATSAGGYGYRHHGYGHHGHHGGHAGYFVGGLLLGTLLAPPRYVPSPPVVYVPRPAYVGPRVSYVAPAPIGRRLLRDIDGNCFERKIDTRGNELRIQLPAADCAW